jgi:hypothetical protein
MNINIIYSIFSYKIKKHSSMKKLSIVLFGLLLAAGCTKTEPIALTAPSPTPLSGAVGSPTPLSGVTGTLSVPTPTEQPTPTATPMDTSKTVYLEWTFKKLPDGAYETPYDQIGLKLSGAVNKSVDLGKLSGCRTTQSFYAPDDKIPAYQVAYLFCWWAGAGDILTVNFEKPDELTVYREEMGEAPEGSNYKPYKIKSIKIPRDLAVEFKETK